MLYRVAIAVIWATVVSASHVEAQSLAQIGGPVNLPPRGFTGQQFVDNRGCVFLRAGFGATVNWVPRVDRLHRPLCGFPPTFGAEVAAALEADMAPDPQVRAATTAPLVAAPTVVAPAVAIPPVVVAAEPAAPQPAASPAPRRMSFMQLLFGTGTSRAVAPAPIAELAPVVVQAAAPMTEPLPPQSRYISTELAGLQPGQIRCFTSAPKLERVLLRSGGTALVCTTGDGTMTGWRPPLFAQSAGVGAALTSPSLTAQTMQGATLLSSGQTGTTVRAANLNSIPTPPRGYKLAWKDDRLNPLRGVGTAQGQTQQDQVWTRDVPAVLVASQTQTRSIVAAQTRTVSVSTMSAPIAGTANSFVQIGTFGLPENADLAKAKLSALGFLVSTSKITRSGKILQIVYAGPFQSAADARTALLSVRTAGFSDAILR